MIEQSFIVVQRREGFEKVYQVGNDLMKAICYQKALIASDEVTDELLSIVKGMIKQEEWCDTCGEEVVKARLKDIFLKQIDDEFKSLYEE